MGADKDKVYRLVTEKIIAMLKKGQIPWIKPWRAGGGVPFNAVTGRKYNGVNVLLLAEHGYKWNMWVTYRQAKKLGGGVKAGEKSQLVVFWKLFKYKYTKLDPDTGEEVEETITRPYLRYYNVFNIGQCELPEGKLEALIKRHAKKYGLKKTKPRKAQRIKAVEDIVKGWADCPEIRRGGGRAYYSPDDDYIKLPEACEFTSDEHEACTKFHEMLHATGHWSRLGRFTEKYGDIFGSKTYSQEELVAELGAQFLCFEAGITRPELTENSAGYIQSWIRRLEDDHKLIVVAGAKAEKGVKLILGETHDQGQDDQEAEA